MEVRRGGLFDRPTRDLLVIMVAATICFAILATGASVVLIELFRPEIDTGDSKMALRDAVNTLIGLLAGFLAGRGSKSEDEMPSHRRSVDDDGGGVSEPHPPASPPSSPPSA